MFARSAASDPLTQGDVVEDCPLVGLKSICRENGYEPPAICTPDELLAEEGD